MLLWRQLASPLIVVLLAAGAVALALGEIADGAVVLAVVVANSVDRVRPGVARRPCDPGARARSSRSGRR